MTRPLVAWWPSSDFMTGAMSVVGLWALRSLWNLFRSPSVAQTARQNSLPLPHLGDDQHLTIFGYDNPGDHPGTAVGILDASFYVCRVEAYCRANRIPYTKLASKGGSENPRGKVPFANVRGHMLDDSTQIIQRINRLYGVDLDKGISEAQQATGHLVQNLLQGSLYWVLAYFAFETEEGRQAFRAEIKGKLPPVVEDLVIAMATRRMHDNLFGHGMGRMPVDAVVAKARADVRTLSTILGNQTYILNTQAATSVDTDCYALLVHLFDDPLLFAHLPWTRELKRECPNLVAFIERMRTMLFPELAKKGN